jgi:hypothetical protein
VSTLPIRVEKRISGTCCYSGCAERAADGDYCPTHDAHERGRDAAKKKRRRQALADDGQCIDGCGRVVGKRKRANGTIQQRRCSKCRGAKLAKERSARASRGVPVTEDGVPGESSDPGPWRVDPGTTWMRFRGKGRRGRLTREEQDREDERDLEIAIEYLAQAKRGISIARVEGDTLPRVQREAAWREVGALAGAAERIARAFRRKCGVEDEERIVDE